MPLVDRYSGLVPANARGADVAQRMVEHIAPMQQQRMQAAFRVQGVPATMYHRLTQGRPCICSRKTSEVNQRLNSDGKASPGMIQQVLTGATFGVSSYSQVLDISGNTPTYTSIQEKAGTSLDDEFDLLQNDEVFQDNGNVGYVDELLAGFDLTSLGLTDVSCPICFGAQYVGGYSVFRGWREVVLATEMQTTAYIDPATMAVEAGTHTFNCTLPRGAVSVGAFRALNGREVVPARFLLDGVDATGRRLTDFFAGRAVSIQVVVTAPITHVEMQASLSNESIYLELPKRGKSADLALLDSSEPFQILLSPDVPHLNTLDILREQQTGKLLVVQGVSAWSTRNVQMLGFEAQVRVAQPQELWHILPPHPVTGRKRVRGAAPTQYKPTSGF